MSDDETGTFSGDVDGEGTLIMPFLPVVSKGGPFDDDAYVCGFEAGRLDSTLEAGYVARCPETLEVTVHAENVAQFDLIAMRYGFEMSQQPWEDDPAWVLVKFTPALETSPSTLPPPTD